MIQRGGQMVLRVLENVKQVTIRPIIEQFVKPGTLVNTDEYDIYGQLPEWGYGHKTVCHSHGEYARAGRGRRRVSRSSREHDGGSVVVIAELASTSPRNFAGTPASLHRIFPVCSQCAPAGQLAAPIPR